jgi:phage terminase small subunit
MRGNSESEVVVVEGMGNGVSVARGVMKKPDEKERLKAAELLGKRFGIFTENVKVEGSVPVVITGGEALED